MITKKIIFSLTLIAALFILGMFFFRNRPVDKKETLLNQLEKQSNQVWQALNDEGIAKEACDKNIPKLEKYFFDTLAMAPQKSPEISDETKNLVKQVFELFNLNFQKIALLPTNQDSPAVAGEDVLYINEPFLKKYSPKAQLFILGHEAQHMINNDMFMRNAINNEIADGSRLDWNSSDPESPLNQFLRLCELRADMQTALTNKDFAQGYIEFAQSLIDQNNDQIGICHPKDSERLAIAQNIYQSLQA